jgi:hypothetical protein
LPAAFFVPPDFFAAFFVPPAFFAMTSVPWMCGAAAGTHAPNRVPGMPDDT